MARKKRGKPARSGPEPSKQWIYFMVNFPLLFVVKVGISRDRRTLLNRWASINHENFGIDFTIFAIKVYGARAIESANKDIGSWLWMKINFFKGTGKTERFFFLAAIPALLMALVAFVIEWAIIGGLVFFTIYTLKSFPE